jgi:tetratricopeptide (TPR) repeat protein
MTSRFQTFPSRVRASLVCSGLLFLGGGSSALCSDNAAPGILSYVNQLNLLDRRPWLTIQLQKFRAFPRLDKAYRLIQEGRIPEAKAELTELLEQNPNDLTTNAVLLVIEQGEHNHRQVVERATAILMKYPAFAPALLYRGLALQSLGQNEKAYQDIKLFLEQKQLQQADFLLALDTYIDLALSERHFPEAAAAAERLAAYRSDFRLHYRKGFALQNLGRFQEAEKSFLNALNSGPDTAQRIETLRLIGQLHLNQSDCSGAARVFEEALQLQPQSPDLLRLAAQAAYQQRDYRRAQMFFQRLVAISRVPSDRMALAQTLVARQEFDAADQQFRQLIEGHVEKAIRVEAYRGLAENARRHKNNNDMAHWWQALLSLEDDVPAHFEMVSLLELGGDFPGMIRHLESILAQGDPSQRFRAHMKLGSVYQALHKLDQAERAFATANREKTSPEALLALAQIADQGNRSEAAVHYVRQAVRLAPNGFLWAQLASYQEKIGQVGESLLALNQALQKTSTDQERKPLYVRQAFLRLRLGQKEEAGRLFALASAADPADPEIHLALAQLQFDSGREDEAIAELRAVPAGESARAAILLGAAYEKKGLAVEAVQAYRQALPLQKHPSEEAADTALRIAFLESGSAHHHHPAAAEAFLQSFAEGSQQKPERLFQAATEWFLEKQWQKASETLGQYLTDPRLSQEEKARGWESLGYTYAQLQLPKKAAEAFDRAIQCGNTKEQIRQSLAFALYKSGDWKRALTEFQAISEVRADTEALLGAAHSYEHLDKPGLAAYYLEKALRQDSNLSEPARIEILQELSTLYSNMGEPRRAVTVLQDLAAADKSDATKLRLISALRASGANQGAETTLAAVDLGRLSKDEHVWYLDEKAALLESRGEDELSLAALTEANALEAKGWRYYKAALTATKLGRQADAVAFLKAAVKEGSTELQVRSALAYALEANGQLAEAAGLFEELSQSDPKNPQWSSAAGYANLKLSRNRASVQWFRKSIDLLGNSAITPSGSDAKAVRENEQLVGLRSEVGQLSRTFDVTFYQGLATNSYSGLYNFGSFTSNPFPNTTGIEFSYTPPEIGRRNGRELQVYTRLLWSNPDVPLQFNRQYYQLGAGLRYKPLPRQNLWISAEKLLHSGDLYVRSWLLRGLYSWNPGYEMKVNRRRWNYSVLFSDTSFVPVASHYFAEYAEARKGLAFNVHNTLTFTPFVVADGRWQSIPSLSQAYAEAGGGVSIRYFFRQNKYEWRRSTWELVLQCKRGTISGGLSNGITYGGCSATSILHF